MSALQKTTIRNSEQERADDARLDAILCAVLGILNLIAFVCLVEGLLW